MASPSSEPGGADPLGWRAGTLLGFMAGAALVCVGAGLAVLWLASAAQATLGEHLLALATGLVVLAPLVSLVGVLLGAIKSRRRLALLALATLAVTLVGMGLAR
ncbi:MAG: hypothetical protein HYW06_00180 [Gemmatimonadetes bacterium]|nr:hypothetical protein [Gemmatimonadota bacterium]